MTVLLELTEREAEAIKKAIIFHKESVLNSDLRETEKQTSAGSWTSVLNKIETASEPQKEVLISYKDLFHIISMAKNEYLNLCANSYISNKIVEEGDFKHISLANAVIMWCNSNRLLKKIVKFDFTDTSSEFEEAE